MEIFHQSESMKKIFYIADDILEFLAGFSEGTKDWEIASRLLVWIILCFPISYWSEYKIAQYLLRDTEADKKEIKSAMWYANIASYMFLMVVVVIFTLIGKCINDTVGSVLFGLMMLIAFLVLLFGIPVCLDIIENKRKEEEKNDG
ncbi:hypothetical protein FACS1894152_7220 [Bacilli bacterium]|nr:hypothetical protein FACS1894152_7220 [Bacilli bacterium]